MPDRLLFPIEVLDRIAKHLELKDVKKLMLFSSRIRKAVEVNALIWKRHVADKSTKSINGKYLPVVRKEYAQTRTWMQKEEKTSKTVKYAPTVPITKMTAFGDILVVSSNSSAVKVFDLSLNLLSTLKGHKGSVWTFDCRDNLLVTGGTDRVAKIWDCLLGVCLKTLVGHCSTIRCVRFTDKYVITGSRDHTIRVWCTKTGMCKHVLTGHKDSIRTLLVLKDKSLVVSGSYDGTVRLWNYRTGKEVRCLFKSPRRIYTLCAVGEHIALAGMEQVVYVVTLQGKLVFRSEVHSSIIFKLKPGTGGVVYAFTLDGSLSKWNVCRRVLAYTIFLSSKAVDFFLLNHLIVVGSMKKISLYCKKSGALLKTSASPELLYSMYATEKSLFYAFRDKVPTILRTVHFGSEQ
ncbi:hypothetical protein NECID01_0235 [Nematocida sp. AWRm77]|nr:hypothetical protein NECID01_0235 [Nematocida sp. AWRm77]